MKECDNCHWYRMTDYKVPCTNYSDKVCEHWGPETNADYIRHTGDVKLARLLKKLIDRDALDDRHLPGCATDPETDLSQCSSDECFTCANTILNWLRAPAEQEDSENEGC